MEAVKADIKPFVKNPESVDIYSSDFFTQLVGMIFNQD